jgi:hypothetical protein
VLVMTEKTMQDTTRTCGRSTTIDPTDCANFAVVYDYSESRTVPYLQLPLLIRCRDCKQLFASDYEEPRCGGCVNRREFSTLPYVAR